ncbi:unnamed protein product [Ranitomeya imitator]|uniref:Reverse transcriptase domain-containing protein n=1 Tax=Ranitomeya imitator TaxID=111125 RepID=A0ABN9MCK8_9NEOB|nr:unnamed protein product [Ranitomeya imitator]
MDKLHYKNEVYRQLGDTTTYKKPSHNPTTSIQNTIKTTLDEFQTRGILDGKTRDFLTKKHPITPVIYILPKIHKDLHNTPGRPIVASTDLVLAPISIYLEKILTPLIRNTRSFLLDTGAFRQIIRNITPVPSNAILVSFDVKDLYTSIPHTNGIHSTRWLLSNNNMSPNLTEFCCTLLSIVLNNNFFLFEDTYYLQTKGSAMGSNVAPPYANAYMGHYEDTLRYTHELFRNHVLTWKRYIDDVFCIWRGDLDSLQTFFQFLKTAWPGLDFTMTHDSHQISFLDTLVNKDTNGNLSTDLYSKPTDRNSLLHYDSFHPLNMKKSIPKSQLNRVTKIVSDPASKDQRISEMKSKFRERGYPSRILDHATMDQTIKERNSATSRIPFVHQYHPAAYRLHKTIRQHWHILQTAYPTINEFQHPFLPCFKRPRNIKDGLEQGAEVTRHTGYIDNRRGNASKARLNRKLPYADGTGGTQKPRKDKSPSTISNHQREPKNRTHNSTPPLRRGHRTLTRTTRATRMSPMKSANQIISMNIRGNHPRIILLTITLPLDQILEFPSGNTRIQDLLHNILQFSLHQHWSRRLKRRNNRYLILPQQRPMKHIMNSKRCREIQTKRHRVKNFQDPIGTDEPRLELRRRDLHRNKTRRQPHQVTNKKSRTHAATAISKLLSLLLGQLQIVHHMTPNPMQPIHHHVHSRTIRRFHLTRGKTRMKPRITKERRNQGSRTSPIIKRKLGQRQKGNPVILISRNKTP